MLYFANTTAADAVGTTDVVGLLAQYAVSRRTDLKPTVYFYACEPSGRATFVSRTTLPPSTLVQPAVAAIRAIDREQPVGRIRTMVQAVEGELTSQPFSAQLLGLFPGVALMLAAVGIYSVLSYIVRVRSREIGIRTALGARSVDILRLRIIEGMWPVPVGIAAGTLAALASARVMGTLVFGVSAADPLTLAGVGAMLALVALMACLVPRVPRLTARPGESPARGVAIEHVPAARGRVQRRRSRQCFECRLRSNWGGTVGITPGWS